MSACSSPTKKTDKSQCVSPLPELVRKQISVFNGSFPEQFAVYYLIIPTSSDAVSKLNHYGILSVIFFSRNPKDYTLNQIKSKSAELKAFYEYPSIFNFPIQKNVSFTKQDGTKVDYIEQDLHVLFPSHHLAQKQFWELETKGAVRIPLFQSPMTGSEGLKERPEEGVEPDLKAATNIVLETYCLN